MNTSSYSYIYDPTIEEYMGNVLQRASKNPT